MEGHRESRLTKGLNRLRFTQQAGACRYDDLLAPVRIHRVGHEAIDWRRGTPIEAIRQHGVDDRSLENSMERAGIVDGIRMCGTL